MDMIVGDESPSQVSDAIKNILFAKSAERIDAVRPEVASSMFGEEDSEDSEEYEEYDENEETDEYEYEEDEEN